MLLPFAWASISTQNRYENGCETAFASKSPLEPTFDRSWNRSGTILPSKMAPRQPQDSPKIHLRPPRIASERPKTPPRRLQDVPKTCQEAPMSPKTASRGLRTPPRAHFESHNPPPKPLRWHSMLYISKVYLQGTEAAVYRRRRLR